MTQTRPNIVWITLDSVRADHTTMHGYRRDTTPVMAALAARSDGIAFDQCISHSTRTPVSVPSMLTGTFPSHHRVGLGAGGCGKVPSSMSTVPELLGECGYYTAAVSRNAYAGEATGLDRGFDEFVSPTFADDLLDYPHLLSLLKFGLNARRHSAGLTTDKHRHPKSYLISDIAKRQLKRRPAGKPVFLYLHYNDPHRPYLPPRSYRERYTDEVGVDPAEAIAFAEDMHENAYEYMAAGLPFSDVQWEMLFAMYDASIAYTDACLESLIDYVHEALDDAIVVVTADHGELFGERGLLGHHIVLNDAVTHVPLVVSGLPDLAHSPEGPVQHVDLVQTLVALAGGDVSRLQGYDLRSESREVAFSQDLRETVDADETRAYNRIRQHNPDFDAGAFHRSLLTVARTSEFKLSHTDEWIRLHELPDETTEVTESYPDISDDMLERIETFLQSHGVPFEEAPERTEHSDEMKQHLREMGYLE